MSLTVRVHHHDEILKPPFTSSLTPLSIFHMMDSLATNYTTTNKYNDSAVCHPLLLAQGNKSEKGLCDDMTSSVVISAIILFIHTMLVLVSIGGLIYKLVKLNRLKKENKRIINYLQVARNPVLMVLGAIIGWSYTFMLMGRVLIGRKFYPCFIFSIIYFVAVPALSTTVILRCLRLLILTKLNDLKVKIGQRQYNLHAKSSDSIKPITENNSQTNPLELEEVKSTDDNLSVSNSSIIGNQTTELSTMSVSRTPSILDQFTIEPKDLKDETVEETMIFRKETVLESFESGKLLTLMRFLVSTKFILLFYFLIIGMHLTIYFIIAIIDYFNYHNDVALDPNQKRNSFTIDSYLFSPSGCGVGAYNQYIFITYFVFYGVIGVLLSIVAFIAKRDVWNIKIEIVIINLFWALIVIAFSIPSLFTIITTYVDYYFPWTITILIGCMWDTFVSMTYPVFFLQRFKSEKSSRAEDSTLSQSNVRVGNSLTFDGESNIRKILTNEKWNNLFLKFSEKCFACEDVMMWNAIEKYRAISSEKQRRELFYNICNTYIRIGAPLELNISRKDFGIPEVEKIYASLKESSINFASRNGSVSPKVTISGSPKKTPTTNNYMNFLFSITPEIFDKIQTACEHNMLDNYTRFQTTYEKQLEKELGIHPKHQV